MGKPQTSGRGSCAYAAGEDSRPRPEYDRARRSLTARERTKAAEPTEMGYRVSVSTVGNLRRRYQREGLLGMRQSRVAENLRVGRSGLVGVQGDALRSDVDLHPGTAQAAGDG